MATNEKMLEELYELLDLYFRLDTGSGVIKADADIKGIEPQLDRIIFREEVLAKITTLIMIGYV